MNRHDGDLRSLCILEQLYYYNDSVLVLKARMHLSAVDSLLYSSSLFLMTSGCYNALEALKFSCLAICSSRQCDTAQRLGWQRTRKVRRKLQTVSLETACVIHGESNTFCSGTTSRSDRGNRAAASHVSVCCVLRGCALIQGSGGLRRGYAIVHTRHWNRLKQVFDGI